MFQMACLPDEIWELFEKAIAQQRRKYEHAKGPDKCKVVGMDGKWETRNRVSHDRPPWDYRPGAWQWLQGLQCDDQSFLLEQLLEEKQTAKTVGAAAKKLKNVYIVKARIADILSADRPKGQGKLKWPDVEDRWPGVFNDDFLVPWSNAVKTPQFLGDSFGDLVQAAIAAAAADTVAPTGTDMYTQFVTPCGTAKTLLYQWDCRNLRGLKLGRRSYRRVFIDPPQGLTEYHWDHRAWTPDGMPFQPSQK
jgi:hypothetical protein